MMARMCGPHRFPNKNAQPSVLQGFFTIYRNLFDRLAREEQLSKTVEFPSFGYSTWDWAASSREQHSQAARHFYIFWLNFTSALEFPWSDLWNVSEAPDRQVRR